jgi:signal transduction histidine kinase
MTNPQSAMPEAEDGLPTAARVSNRLQGLMVLSRAVSASLDVDEALRAVTRAAMAITSPSFVSVWAADERTATLTLAAVSDEQTFADFPGKTLHFGQGLVGEVARTRQAVHVPDVFVDGCVAFADWGRRHGFVTWDGIPILFENSILGVLTYSRRVPFADRDETHDVLAFFVDQAAIVIRNAKRLEALLEVNRQLSSIQSVEALLATIAEACGRLLASDSVGFRLVDGDEMVLTGTWGDADSIALKPRLRFGESLSGVVASTGQPLNLANALDDPRRLPLHREAAERLGYRAWLGVPVKLGELVLGVLNMRTHRPEGFSESDVSIATAFASQAAVALENARLYAEAHRKTQRLEVLHRLALGLTATLGRQEVFTTVARAATELFGDVGCSLWLLEQQTDELTLVADEGLRFPALRETRTMKVGQGLMGSVVAERRPIVLGDIQTRGHNQALSQAEGFRAAMAVPLLFGERCFGGLSVRRRSMEPFRADDVDLLTALAGHAAITIEQARLYEDLIRTNAQLQAQAGALQAKNSELDSFAYAVSHDLKAPLVTLQGMAGLLTEDCRPELGEQGRHYVSRIVSTVGQMGVLIADVLTLSKIGREGRPTEVVSLDEVVDLVLQRLAEPRRARGVKLTRGALGEVRAIRTQMEQVFSNLIGNAVKYLGDTVAPVIEIGRIDRGAGVEYYVRDNGIGIDPAYHAKIFEAFQRLKDIEAEGTGVGLAIVKKIAEAAAGRLRVESAVGDGSTFFFTWPGEAESFRPAPPACG